MSLHLGNLPPRIRAEDLERVFRRFGRCTLQVKDKYGFVVYDYPASAEKALKVLRGKLICGEAISVSWSNRQPHTLQRFARGGKSFEPPGRKYPVKENIDRRLNSNDRRDYGTGFRQADGDGRKFGSADFFSESTSYHPDDLKSYNGERDHASLNDHNRIGGAGKNHLEDDRWREQVVDPSNGMENDMEFDRYEPHHSDEKKDSDEHQNMSMLSVSPSNRKGQERSETGFYGRGETSSYHSNRKSQQTCYACGEVGHKRRECPLELKRHASRSEGRLVPGGENLSRRGHESDREPSTSRSRQRSLKHEDSPPQQMTPKGGGRESSDKKRNRQDDEGLDKHHDKRPRGASSSSNYSDFSLSKSRSPSKLPLSSPRSPSPSKWKSKFKSNSKSKHLKDDSPSPPSLSSASFRSRSRTSVSQSISSIFSPSPVDKHLSPSINERQKADKDPVVNVVGPANNEDLSEKEKPFQTSAVASGSENIAAAEENECEAGAAEVEKEEMEEPHNEDDEPGGSVSKCSGEELRSKMPQPDDGDQNADILSLQSVKEKGDSPQKEIVREHMLAPVSDASLRSNAVRMSSEEIYMVLKHYGMQSPEGMGKDLPAEVYFGSARSWPWELIYYRRLKKGPISTENYARRIAQNEEFGIVDRYIRSSSGWGEPSEDNS